MIPALEEEMGNEMKVKGWGNRDDVAISRRWLPVSVTGSEMSEIACESVLAVNGWLEVRS